MSLICFAERKNNTHLISFFDKKMVAKSVFLYLKPLVETWSKQKLSPEFTMYGVRRYSRGASLAFHVDRLPTHILSAILQV